MVDQINMDRDKLISYIHDIINKNISAQSYTKILAKSELKPEQAELLTKANESLKESIDLIKSLRKEIR